MTAPHDPIEGNALSYRWSAKNPPSANTPSIRDARPLQDMGPLPFVPETPPVSPDVPDYMQIVREQDPHILGVWAARYWMRWGREHSNPGGCWLTDDGQPTGYSPSTSPGDCRTWDPCRKSDQAMLLLEALNADLPELLRNSVRTDLNDGSHSRALNSMLQQPPVSLGWNSLYDADGCQYPGWWVTACVAKSGIFSHWQLGFGMTPQIAVTRAAALAGRQRLVENRARSLHAPDQDEYCPLRFLTVEVLSGRKIAKRIPHSEVCMHMQVAGKITLVELLPNRNAAQLYNLDGSPFSSPILPSEAGIREAYGIYYCHPGAG